MNADDILTAARERLAEIDAQIAALTAERARLLRMTERETTPVKVPSCAPVPPLDWGPQSPDAFTAFRLDCGGGVCTGPTLSYG